MAGWYFNNREGQTDMTRPQIKAICKGIKERTGITLIPEWGEKGRCQISVKLALKDVIPMSPWLPNSQVVTWLEAFELGMAVGVKHGIVFCDSACCMT